MCIQSCINLPHSQQHRLKDHSHPRLRTSRTASAPPLSNIFGQSLGFAKRRLLYNRQCKVAKQPWPSPCRNGPPAALKASAEFSQPKDLPHFKGQGPCDLSKIVQVYKVTGLAVDFPCLRGIPRRQCLM